MQQCEENGLRVSVFPWTSLIFYQNGMSNVVSGCACGSMRTGVRKKIERPRERRHGEEEDEDGGDDDQVVDAADVVHQSAAPSISPTRSR